MKGWNILEREDSTVELQSIKGEALTDVLEEFAMTHQIDPLPVINKSTVILKNIKDLLVLIKSSVENYDCDEELGGVVMSARKVNLTMNQYLSSISPPTDPDLCDARLVAMSLALDNLVLVTSSILTGCQWLQDSLRDIDEKIADLRGHLNQDPEDIELTKV